MVIVCEVVLFGVVCK